MILKKIYNSIIESYELLILSIIIVVMILLYIKYEMSGMKKCKLDKIIKKCKTGDIILFRWHFMDIIFRMASKYSHIGMIYKENDNVYIIEMHPEEGKKIIRNGVNRYNLKKRLKEYNGTCYYLQLVKNIKVDNQKLKKRLKDYKKISFDENFRYSYGKSWLYNKLSWKLSKKKKKKTMYCSEFVGYILKDLKILSKDYNISLLTPSSFENIIKNGKKLYKNPYEICL